MFKSQPECKSPKILSCLLRQKVLVWEHVFKIIVCSGRRCVWINMKCSGVRDACKAGDRRTQEKESDRKNGSIFTLKFVYPESFGSPADAQVSLKWENDLVFGSLGMETVWTQCALNSRSISLQYQPDPTWLPPPTMRSTNNMKWNFIWCCSVGKWLKVALG